MKKKYIIGFILLFYVFGAFAQEYMAPAPAQKGSIYLTGGTLHIGNGEVRENKVLEIKQGKIHFLSELPNALEKDQILDLKGKQIYPGLIGLNNNLGLVEVNSTNSTHDEYEFGDFNPNIRSIVGYNTDSKVINTVRSNGILLVEVVPSGTWIRGSSSVVQLDAWNWEDAAYSTDLGIHMNIPSMIKYPNSGNNSDRIKHNLEEWERIKDYFKEAELYAKDPQPKIKNLKFEAMKGLFSKEKILFAHCDWVKEILLAIELKNEFGLKLVIVGGADSWRIGDLLSQNEIPVVLHNPHNLPAFADDAVDLPYKMGAILKKSGVLFSISTDGDEAYMQLRNTPFVAGTLAAYGLDKEEALQSITENAAKILGIEKRTGTLEEGKDANIVISNGDILDMRSHEVILAFIQGRKLDLNNKQKDLYHKYLKKYQN